MSAPACDPDELSERFRKGALRSVRFALSLLASEGLRYPAAVITGGAAMVLSEPELYMVVKTYDVDLLMELPEDAREVRSALIRYERVHPGEIQVELFPEAVKLRPLGSDLMPVDFVCTYRPRIQELFEYTHSNAVAGEAIDEAEGAKIYCARLEDAILCKLVFGRRKDISTVRQILSELGERVDREYLDRVAAEHGVARVAFRRRSGRRKGKG